MIRDHFCLTNWYSVVYWCSDLDEEYLTRDSLGGPVSSPPELLLKNIVPWTYRPWSYSSCSPTFVWLGVVWAVTKWSWHWTYLLVQVGRLYPLFRTRNTYFSNRTIYVCPIFPIIDVKLERIHNGTFCHHCLIKGLPVSKPTIWTLGEKYLSIHRFHSDGEYSSPLTGLVVQFPDIPFIIFWRLFL